jgi:hypothetical protein
MPVFEYDPAKRICSKHGIKTWLSERLELEAKK